MGDLSQKEVSCDIQASPYYERMKHTSTIRNYQESMVKTNKVCTEQVRCIEFLKGPEKRNRLKRTEKLMEKKDFLRMDRKSKAV